MYKVSDFHMAELVNVMLVQTQGSCKETKAGVQLHCWQETAALCLTYAAHNTNSYPVYAVLDCSNSTGVVFSSRTSSVEALVPAKSWKSLLHAQLAPGASRCTLIPQFNVRLN